MIRRLLNIVSAASLLICVAATVLWIRSYWRSDGITWMRWGYDRSGDHGDISHHYSFFSAQGGIRFDFSEEDDRNNGTSASIPVGWRMIMLRGAANQGAADVEHSQFGSRQWGWAGFAEGSESYRGNHSDSEYQYIVVPDWSLIGIAAIGAVPILLRIGSRRKRASICRRCSYNLTGNTSGTCPECGTRIV